MHTLESVICNIVSLLTERHGVDSVPDLAYLLVCRDAFSLSFNIFSVEISERFIDCNLALGFFFLKAVINAADIGGVNVSASSAAFDIFDGGFAEKGNLFALF